MKFIATADWQLGMTAHYLGEEARPRFHRARFDALVRMAALAEERGARFVVVGGDVFESNQLDRAVVSRTFEALKAFTVPVVLLPGNHDPLDAFSIYDSHAFTSRVPAHVHVLRDEQPLRLFDDVEIVGAPWPSKRPDTDLVARALDGVEPAPDGVTRIVVGHGAVDLVQPDRDALATISVSAMEEALEEGRAHFVVLGDRHGTKSVSERIWYPGSPEVTHRREIDPGNVLLVDAGPDHVEVTMVPVGVWKFVSLADNLSSAEDVESFAERLFAMPSKETTAVWLQLTGTLSIADMARLEAVLAEAGDLFARIDHWQRHTDLVVVPDDSDFHELGLSGFAQDALEELKELAAGDSDDRTAAQDALGLLYRLAGGGR